MKDFLARGKNQFKDFEKTLLDDLSKNCHPAVRNLKIAGEINENDRLRVGIVGSRKMTVYGKQVLGDICRMLAAENVTVVSGLMYGVDIEAQKQMLKNKGRTIGVLGYGFDYLSSNSYAYEVAKTIVFQNAGAVISEFVDEQPGQQWTFPKRNRIVAALSDYLIIIDGSCK